MTKSENVIGTWGKGVIGRASFSMPKLEPIDPEVAREIREELDRCFYSDDGPWEHTGVRSTPTSGAGDGQGEPNEKRESAEPKLPKRPGTGASREDWYQYKHDCDKGGIVNFTHAQLAEMLSLAPGTTRNYYADWLAEHGDVDDTLTETGAQK